MPNAPFLYLRHGQTDWNVEGRKQGHTDIPLNATGLAQAEIAAQKLKGYPVDLILTSPLLRAYQTAEIVAETIGAKLLTEPLLIERSFGRLEGKTQAEAIALGELTAADDWHMYVPADAEPWDITLSRSRGIVSHHVNAHPGKTLLFVSHGAFFRALYESLGGPYFRLANATPYRFKPNQPIWDLEEIS